MTFIETKNGHLYYEKYPGGEKKLLLFHGFGQDHRIFQDWIPVLTPLYTVYSFDLFYHGKSNRTHGALSKEDWKQTLDTFLEKEMILHFSIIGFSLGGRFAIASAIIFRERLEKITLIAPDAIFLSIWYKLATYPGIRRIFRYVMHHPKRLDQLVNINEHVKLINPYLGDFVRKELGDLEKRVKVYRSWNDFKSLGYLKTDIYTAFRQSNFKKQIILGSKDRIIHPKDILPSIKQMGKFEVNILPLKHHQLIKVEVAKLITIKDQ